MCCCFPPSQKVLTTRGYISISNLKLTDKLIALKPNRKGELILKETPLYTFLHFDPALKGEYLKLNCDNGAEVVMSLEHVVFRYIRNGQVEGVPAKNIRIGDRLVHLNEEKKLSYPTVVKIGDKEIIQGAFTPLSKSGTLIVEGFMASCYAHLGSFTLSQAHASLAPLRFWYKVRGKIGYNEKKIGNCVGHYAGIHPFEKLLMGLLNRE